MATVQDLERSYWIALLGLTSAQAAKLSIADLRVQGLAVDPGAVFGLADAPYIQLHIDQANTNPKSSFKVSRKSGLALQADLRFSWAFGVNNGVSLDIKKNGFDLTGYTVTNAELGLSDATGANRKAVSWTGNALGNADTTLDAAAPNATIETVGATVVVSSPKLILTAAGFGHAYASVTLTHV